jgi:hypothetical protein
MTAAICRQLTDDHAYSPQKHSSRAVQKTARSLQKNDNFLGKEKSIHYASDLAYLFFISMLAVKST